VIGRFIAILGGCACIDASAHAFVQSYTLPIPFSLYAGGAAVALALSFVAATVFAKVPNVELAAGSASARFAGTGSITASGSWGRAFSVLLLLVCIVSGFIGTADAFRNINMTLFWIVFFLGVPYAIVLFGDFYAAVNPWAGFVSAIGKITGQRFTGCIAYPSWLGHFPGLVLYMALIATELFMQQRPVNLSIAISAYTLIMLAGAWVFGKDTWLARAEVFGILCRLLGQISVRAIARPSRLRRPPADLGLILFVLFMLSSTAFDGLHSTAAWAAGYWKVVYPQISWVDTVWGSANGNRYAASTAVYGAWQWAALFASPFIYFGVFALFMRISGAAGRSSLGTRDLMVRFTFTLLPIAFVYHFSHYFTLVLAQAPKLVQLISDPFGFGWNLFGTADWRIPPVMLDVDVIWHTQVAMIVLGHMASVLVAHLESLRTFETPRRATFSQLPMLALMVLFTASGLWILSLPISSTS
jgi:hypothetical protein